MSTTATEVLTKTMEQIVSNSGVEHGKLTRTTSLEKIKYFCTQQYYIMPVILACLKSSQSVLHTTMVAITDSLCLLDQIKRMYANAKSAGLGLRIGVSLFCAVLLCELSYCLYVVYAYRVPYGMIFLICCWLFISHLTYQCSFYNENDTNKNNKKSGHKSRKSKND